MLCENTTRSVSLKFLYWYCLQYTLADSLYRPVFANVKFTVLIPHARFYCHLHLHGTMHDFHAHEVSTGVMCIVNFGQRQMTQLPLEMELQDPTHPFQMLQLISSTNMFWVCAVCPGINTAEWLLWLLDLP